MTPERKKLIETMARQIDPPSWDDRKHMQTLSETRLRRRKARQKAEADLRAIEDKLNVTVVPNEATEEMQIAGGLGVRVRAIAKDKLNAAIARSPYRREG